MTTYIVRDREGREVARVEAAKPTGALIEAWEKHLHGNGLSIANLMERAGYIAEKVPEMIEVPVKDLEEVIGVFYENDTPARDRLRSLVEKHRSGKP